MKVDDGDRERKEERSAVLVVKMEFQRAILSVRQDCAEGRDVFGRKK